MKTFLSIGSGPGIGRATAERFALEGFRSILTGRSSAKLDDVASKLTASGHAVETAVLDASHPEAIRALIAGISKKYGAIDVMHYNAASLRQATIEEQPGDTFVTDLAVNIGGAMAAIQAVQGPMAMRREGTILLTGGGLAFAPSPSFISLSVGKAGLRSLALGLFESLKARGIHIGIVNVAAAVAAGSQTSANIADKFWKLYESPMDQWVAEVTYSE
jgi:short-subunit dehydrogenase